MARINRTTAAVVSLGIAAGPLWLGRITAPSSPAAAVELRRSEHPGWAEVWRAGELDSGCQGIDGAVNAIIVQVLGDAQELYQFSSPAEPRRGRGPDLQASR